MLVTILLWLVDMTHHLVYTQDWELGTRASGQSVPYQKVASARQTVKIRSFGHPSTMQIVQQPALGLCSHVCHILPVLHVIFVCMPNINILMTKFSKPQQNISGRIRDGCRWPLGTYMPGCLCPRRRQVLRGIPLPHFTSHPLDLPAEATRSYSPMSN